jgi:apolipoprotein D and lipocalin family protein
MSATSTLKEALSETSSRTRRDVPPRVVARLDLPRYAGTWYEIESIPKRKRTPYEATTQTLTLRPNGRVGIFWRSLNTRTNRVRTLKETASTPNPWEPAKLKVRRRLLLSRDHWVLELDRNYEWALVGTPDRKHAWIFSRLPLLDERVVARLHARLKYDGFPVERLQRTEQLGV